MFRAFLMTLIASALFAGLAPAQHIPTADRPALLEVKLGTAGDELSAFAALDLDVAYVSRRDGETHIVADGADMEALIRAGIPFRVLHEDVVDFYRRRIASASPGAQGAGTTFSRSGAHLTYSGMAAQLDAWRSQYPNLISVKTSIGKSRQGRDIWAAKISDNPDVDENEPEAIIDCLTHAREPMGMTSTLYFVEWVLTNYPADPMAKFLVENREMWVVPVQNPDGYVYNEQTNPNGGGMWRKNRRNNGGGSYGVDLNRNWSYKWGYSNQGSSSNKWSDTYRGPSALSEPEDQGMANFIKNRGAVERMSIHTYGNYWLIPWCYDEILTQDDDLFRELGVEMAPPDYETGTSWELLYVVNGGSLDWDYGDQNIITFSPEMGRKGDGFWPHPDRIPEICEETLPSLQYFYAIAGSYLKLKEHRAVDITGDLNGYVDAGEQAEIVVTLRNLGLLDCQGPVDLTLATASPHVNLITGTVQMAAVPRRANGDNGAQPFLIEISPTAPYGEIVKFSVAFTFDGVRFEDTFSVVLGTPRRMITDDLEGSITGWTLGASGDTATAGVWAHCDPTGTWVSGEPVQPEDDHSLSGTMCFVTGDGPAGAGPDDHDVDGGKTTLFSPLFDLTGGTMPRVGFSRWYGHPGNYGIVDNFKAAISNDGGVNWIELELVDGQSHNAWVERAFDVEDFLPPTDRMMLRFVTRDQVNDSTVEGAVDDIWAECYSTHPVVSLYGSLITGETATLGLSWLAGSQVGIFVSLKEGPGLNLPGGVWYLDWPLFELGIVGIPAGTGAASLPIPVPSLPQLVGVTLHFQALGAGGPGPLQVSNKVSGTVAE